MRATRSAFVALLLLSLASSQVALGASARNAYVAGSIFIPMNASGILGAPPSGHGQSKDTTILDIAGGPLHGSVSFYVTVDLSDRDVAPGEWLNANTAFIQIALDDMDFDPQIFPGKVTLVEAATVTLLADGPVDPANPGAFAPPANSPTVQITTANYQALQDLSVHPVPVAQTNNTTIVYRLELGGPGGDFVESAGGPTVAEILTNASVDHEFTLLVTLSSVITPIQDGLKISNTRESFEVTGIETDIIGHAGNDNSGSDLRFFARRPLQIVGWREPHAAVTNHQD